MRVYLQIEKRAIEARTLFEKKNTININIPVGLAVKISGSNPQGSGSTPGLGSLLAFYLIFSPF